MGDHLRLSILCVDTDANQRSRIKGYVESSRGDHDNVVESASFNHAENLVRNFHNGIIAVITHADLARQNEGMKVAALACLQGIPHVAVLAFTPEKKERALAFDARITPVSTPRELISFLDRVYPPETFRQRA